MTKLLDFTRCSDSLSVLAFPFVTKVPAPATQKLMTTVSICLGQQTCEAGSEQNQNSLKGPVIAQVLDSEIFKRKREKKCCGNQT